MFVKIPDVLVGRGRRRATGDPAQAEGGQNQADRRAARLHPQREAAHGVEQLAARDALEQRHGCTNGHAGDAGEQQDLPGPPPQVEKAADVARPRAVRVVERGTEAPWVSPIRHGTTVKP